MRKRPWVLYRLGILVLVLNLFAPLITPTISAEDDTGTPPVVEESGLPETPSDPEPTLPPDGDGDGVPDEADSCPSLPNPDQADADGDDTGDACDETPLPVQDADGDGIADQQDTCPAIANVEQTDADGDGVGDACDETPLPVADADGDGVPDESDLCPKVADADQTDADDDGAGNACDATPDGDPPVEEPPAVQERQKAAADLGTPTTGMISAANLVTAEEPTLTIEKTGPAEVLPGETLTYTITVTNTGATPLSGTFNISDGLPFGIPFDWMVNPVEGCMITGNPAVVICSPEADLANGESISLTLWATVPADIACGTRFTNQANVTAPDPGGSGSSNTVETLVTGCVATPEPATVTDGTCVDGVFTAPSVGLPETEGITYTIDPDTVPGTDGEVTVIATLQDGYDWGDTTGWTVDGTTAETTVIVDSPFCFTIEKTGPSTVAPGETLEYTISFINTGERSIPEFYIEDSLPQLGLGAWTDSSDACSVFINIAYLDCSIVNDLPAVGFFEVTVAAEVPAYTTCGTRFANVARVAVSDAVVNSNTVETVVMCETEPELPTVTRGSCVDGVFTPPSLELAETEGIAYTTDPDPVPATGGQVTVTAMLQDGYTWGDTTGWDGEGNQRTTTTFLDAPYCYTVSKTGPATVAPGETLEYTITVTNTGPVTIDLFFIQDEGFPFGDVSVWLATGDGCEVLEDLRCMGRDLATDQSVSVTLRATVPADIDCASPLRNSAIVIPNLGSPDGPVYGSGTVVTQLACPGAIPELRTVTHGSCVDGVFTPPNVELADTEAIVYTMAPESVPETGGEVTITATLQVGYAWIDPLPDGWAVDGDTGTYTVELASPPCVTIEKSGPETVAPGGELEYTITVTNTGVVPFDPVHIYDPLPFGPVSNWTVNRDECSISDIDGIPWVFCSMPNLAVDDSISVTVTGTVSTDTACGTQYVNQAEIPTDPFENSELVEYSTVVRTEVTCPEEVTPEEPTVTDGTCVDGVFTPPSLELPDIPGITYTTDPDPVPETGGAFTVIATLQHGYVWADPLPDGWTVEGNTAVMTVTLDSPLCLSLVKTGPAAVAPGGTIEYTITLTNSGPHSIATVYIEDQLPLDDPSAWTLSDDPCDVFSGDGVVNRLDCEVQDLRGGGSFTVTVTATLPATTACDAEALSNQARALPIGVSGDPGQTLTSNAVETEVTCPHASPEEPTVTGGSCVDGIFTPLSLEMPETEGIAFATDPDPVPDTGGEVTITATLQNGYQWIDPLPDGWTLDGNKATTTVTVTVEPCVELAPGAPSVTEASCADGVLVPPTLDVDPVNGVTFAFDPAAPYAPGQTVTVTATLGNGYAWADDLGAWTVVSPTEAEFTVTFEDVACETVVPDVPTVEEGACEQGVLTMPSLALPEDTTAITYTRMAGNDVPGGTGIVTATLADGYAWPDDPAEVEAAGWHIATPTTATYLVTYDAVACEEVAPVAPLVMEAGCRDGAPTLPTVELAGDSDAIAYTLDGEVEPGGTVTVSAKLAEGYGWPAAGLPPGWELVDPVTARWTTALDEPDCPWIAVSKTVTSTDRGLELGDLATYDIVVTNAGNVPLADITVTDPLVTDLACDEAPAGGLEPGGSIACTASHRMTEADLLAGAVVNTVRATGAHGEEVVEAEAEATATTAAAAPALTLEKEATTPEGEDVIVGTTITYTFTVTNSGNLTVAGIVVEDPLAGLEWDAASRNGQVGSLAPGESRSITATYRVTPVDAVTGSVTNTAVAAGEVASPVTSARFIRAFQATTTLVRSNEASVTVPLDAQPAPSPDLDPTPEQEPTPQTGESRSPTPGHSGDGDGRNITRLPSTGHGPDARSGAPDAWWLLAVAMIAASLAFGIGRQRRAVGRRDS